MAKEKSADDVAEVANPLEAPGFHVMQEKTFIGTYPTREDAEAFIEGHIAPQHLKAEIVEGKAE